MRIGLIAGGGRLPEYVEEAAQESDTLGLVIALDPFVPVQKFPKAWNCKTTRFQAFKTRSESYASFAEYNSSRRAR